MLWMGCIDRCDTIERLLIEHSGFKNPALAGSGGNHCILELPLSLWSSVSFNSVVPDAPLHGTARKVSDGETARAAWK